MNSGIFFAELRRRNVFKVAIAYIVVAWFLYEAAATLLFGLEERSSLLAALIVFVVLGFVFAMYISWAFEATPEGMKRTENVPRDAVLPTWSRKKFAAFIIGTALLASSLLVLDLIRTRANPSPISPTAAP